MKSHKLLTLLALIFALLIPTIVFGQPRTAPKNWMFATMTTDKTEKFVGVMVNEETCQALAKALNEWAKVPPITPLTFYCKPEPVQV